MATSITTQADVLEYGLITDNEIHRLTTERMKADNWATLHKRGWTKTLDMLALRASPLEEDDLTTGDITALKPATVFFVVHFAYSQAEFVSDEDQNQAERYWNRAMKELQEVRLLDGDAPRGSYDYRRARRM